MREFVFFFLNGMLTLTGGFLSVFWGELSVSRARKLTPALLRTDRYFWLAAALGLNSAGSVILFGSRVLINLRYGLPMSLMGIGGLFVAFGLATVLAAMVMMVWLADLERSHPRWLWGMGAITVVWTSICIWLAA